MTPGRLPGPAVRAVLFDYGMTLVTFERPEAALLAAYAAIAELLDAGDNRPRLRADELLTGVHARVEAAVSAHDVGGSLDEIDLDPVYLAAYAGLGVALEPEELDSVQRLEQRAWFSGVQLGDGVINALEWLHARGIRTGICSNAPYHAATLREQLAHLGIDRLVSSATFSADAGSRKPSQAFFERALEDLVAEPASTVMVGDRLDEDVIGAQRVGMRGVLLRQHRVEADPDGLADAAIEHIGQLPYLF